MSGGEYSQTVNRLLDISEEVRKNNIVFAKILGEVALMLHTEDYFICGDIGEEEYRRNFENFIKELKDIIEVYEE